MKIILFCLPGMGDTIMFTPCLKPLREKYPKAKIVALTMFSASEEVLKNNPNLDQVILWEFLTQPKLHSLRFIWRLRKERFDLSITPFPAYRRDYHLISFAVGAEERIAHRFSKGYFTQFTFLNTKTIPMSEELRNVENNLNLLTLLGIHLGSEELKLDLNPSEAAERFAHTFLLPLQLSDKNPIIGVHPGSIHYRKAWHKRWPKEKFASLCDRLITQYKAKILIFEGPSERGLAKEIADLMRNKPVTVANLKLGQVMAIIKKCHLFIANNSGLMHIAAATGTPVVVITGPTNPKWDGPWGVKYRIVRKALTCSPCYTYTLPYFSCRRKDFACLYEVTVEEVLEKVKELYNRK